MDIKSGLPRLLVTGVLIAGVVVVINNFKSSDNQKNANNTIDVKVPSLSSAGLQGQKLFEKNCMVCHGKNAGGSDQGPPLIHIIYEPSHHGDQSFLIAAKLGVRAHHWQFGNMPAQPQVSEGDALQIVGYIREVQRANGIN